MSTTREKDNPGAIIGEISGTVIEVAYRSEPCGFAFQRRTARSVRIQWQSGNESEISEFQFDVKPGSTLNFVIHEKR